MPLGSFRHQRGGSMFLRWMTLTATAWLACSAPDGSDLYRPLGAGGSAAGGFGGSGGSSDGGLGGAAGAGGAGVGGNLPVAGAATGGGSGAAGESGAAPPDGGTPDAGGEPDAGPPPSGCEPSAELCDGIDNDCDGAIDSSAACPDGCTGLTLGDRAYILCAEPVERSVALARCGGEGMRLAWIETFEENAAVLAALAGLELASGGEVIVQIGASDQDDEDEWFWIGNAAASDGFQFWSGNAAEDGGAPVGGAYANWAAGEPNNSDNEDCGALSVGGSSAREPGEWDDRSCLEELPFLCEES